MGDALALIYGGDPDDAIKTAAVVIYGKSTATSTPAGRLRRVNEFMAYFEANWGDVYDGT